MNIREPKTEDDINFIYSTWSNQVNESYLPIKGTPRYLYVKATRRAAERVIKSTGKIKLACDPENENVIYGYIVYEDKLPFDDSVIIERIPISHRKVIHFLYIKQAFRGNGFATKLVESAGINLEEFVHTCWTNDTFRLVQKYNKGLYVPLGLFDR